MVKDFLAAVRQELDSLLVFWMRAADQDNGGFIGRIDGFNRAHKDAAKGMVLNARILWAFSAAALRRDSVEEKLAAKRAYDYLHRFFDHEFGGVYWELRADGAPLNMRKQVYGQAFAIYALSEYYALTKDGAALQKAIDLFQLIEQYSFDPVAGGYLEAFDRQWRPLDDMRLSPKDANEKKTMNTHLHVMEAYANLYKAWNDPLLETQLKKLIRIFLEKILDRNTFHLNLFFNEAWETKSRVYSFGHDIEAAWLLCQAAEAVRDEELMRETRNTALRIADAILKEGMDIDGGLMNEGEGGRVTDSDKHWWPQAEAAVGLINAWQISQDDRYMAAAVNVWNFIEAALIDKKHGEWHFRISKAWIPYIEEDKAGFWKCPYHNIRACLEILERIEGKF